MYSCPVLGCPGPQFAAWYSQLLTLLSVVILADGLLGAWGARFAYPAGAVLSILLLAVMGYTAYADNGFPYLQAELNGALIGSVLAAAAVVMNAVALRARSTLSEQANPMNLPVFG